MIRFGSGYTSRRKFAIVTAILLITSISNPQGFLNNSYASPLFGAPISVSSDGFSGDPRIAVSGSDVYLVWQDSSFNIAFSFSNDDGISFTLPLGTNPPTELSIDSGSFSPQIAASGTDAYVVWQNAGFVSGNISFLPISDSGITLGIETVINGDSFSSDPQVAASAGTAAVVWVDEFFNIASRTTTDGGATFTPDLLELPASLSSDGLSSSPQIAVSGSDVYLVWQAADGSIVFRVSNDNGATFTPDLLELPASLSSDFASFSPKIVASGPVAYVVWQNENGNISFNTITGIDASIGAETEISSGGLSSSPQIAVSGSDVYAVWADASSGNSDILFKTITGPIINLSGNSGNSFSPKVAAFLDEVYVTWFDATLGGFDVLLKSSANNGDSFGGLQKLNSGGIATSPQKAASAINSFVVWSQDNGFETPDDPLDIILDVFF